MDTLVAVMIVTILGLAVAPFFLLRGEFRGRRRGADAAGDSPDAGVAVLAPGTKGKAGQSRDDSGDAGGEAGGDGGGGE